MGKDLEKLRKEWLSYHKANKELSHAEEAFLSHHGILGMKWGIRRFQNKDGTRTAEGKKRYGNNENAEEEKSPLVKSLEADGYEKDAYGNYVKTIRSPNDNIKKLSISADIESKFGDAMSDDDYKSLLKSIETNYNDIQIKISQGMADWAFGEESVAPWGYEDSGLTVEQQRKTFIDRLGTQMDFNTNTEHPGYAYIRVMGDGYGEFGIDDGGAYGDHWLTTEIDWKTEWKNPKIKGVSVEG